MKTIFKDLEFSVKQKLFKAILKGKIKKEDITSIEEVSKLLSHKKPLIMVKNEHDNIYIFCGKKVSKEEFERLEKLASALGIEDNTIIDILVVKSPYNIPIANKEEDIIL